MLKRKSAKLIYLTVILLVSMFAVRIAIVAGRHRGLIAAIKRTDSATIRRLLASGADPNTPVYTRAPRFLERFFDNGRFPGSGNSPLELAVEENVDFPAVKALVDHGALINVTDGYHETPLLKAANRGRADIIRLLVEHGADVNISQSHDGPRTPIMAAVESGDLDSVRLLLQHGAKLSDRDGGGQTLIQIARGHRDMIALLKEAGER
jgi:ankyrin repeat protein